MAFADPETAGVILVVGMHRSGTSLFSQMCARAGLHLGGPLLNGYFPDNEQGYWEHGGVVATQTRLLIDLGRGPMSKVPLPFNWQFWPEAATARRQLQEITQRETAGGRVWLVKDPRICRLLPLWQDLLLELGIPLKVVLCIRSPAEVAASLKHRQKLDERLACQLWTDHHRDILSAVPVPDAIVAYDEVMARPVEILAAVFHRLGLAASPERIAQAALAVTPGLRHHHDLDLLEAETERAFTEAAYLYEQLLNQSILRSPFPQTIDLPEPRTPNATRVLIVTRPIHPAHFLSRTLRSVLSQTHSAWRMVIVNDGDPESEVVQVIAPYRAAFGDRLVVHHLPQRIGEEAANNLAIRAGDEDCIAIHPDGDTWAPGFLESALAELDSTRAMGVITRSTVVHEQLEAGQIKVCKVEPCEPDLQEINHLSLLHRNRFPPISFLYRRLALTEVGHYRPDFPGGADWDFNLRFTARFPIAMCNQTLAARHLRPTNILQVHSEAPGQEA